MVCKNVSNIGELELGLDKQTLSLDFDSWVKRMKTPEDQIKTLRYLQEGFYTTKTLTHFSALKS
jgi:hypothetical protein